MQQNYPLTDDHMLSREYLKEVSSLSFDEDFPLFSSDLAYFTGLKSLRCTDLPQITELDLSRNPELTELYWNRYPFSEPYLQQKPGICSAV